MPKDFHFMIGKTGGNFIYNVNQGICLTITMIDKNTNLNKILKKSSLKHSEKKKSSVRNTPAYPYFTIYLCGAFT